ncbi:MAG: tyrosine-protein phosphatase [Acidimicrobiia bacterium]|nr:tyrosine-protein phosphatase [Acidimicrobiia bacterium]
MPQVHLERVGNMRDIGGVPTLSGEMVATGRLYRSASPHEMTRADRDVFETLAIWTFIDLRTRWETERQPYEIPGGRLLNIPLAAEDSVASVTERFMAGELTNGQLEDWWGLIGLYDAPEAHAAGIRAVFEALIGVPPGEAVVLHCRGGKDRTGLIAALALEALGVDRALIVDDFLLSREAPHHFPPGEAEAMQRAMDKMELTRKAIRSLSGVRPEWLLALLEGLDARYGSIAAYLSDRVGLGTDGVEWLRRGYLQPI